MIYIMDWIYKTSRKNKGEEYEKAFWINVICFYPYP
jgi:hypothetical protein